MSFWAKNWQKRQGVPLAVLAVFGPKLLFSVICWKDSLWHENASPAIFGVWDDYLISYGCWKYCRIFVRNWYQLNIFQIIIKYAVEISEIAAPSSPTSLQNTLQLHFSHVILGQKLKKRQGVPLAVLAVFGPKILFSVICWKDSLWHENTSPAILGVWDSYLISYECWMYCRIFVRNWYQLNTFQIVIKYAVEIPQKAAPSSPKSLQNTFRLYFSNVILGQKLTKTARGTPCRFGSFRPQNTFLCYLLER